MVGCSVQWCNEQLCKKILVLECQFFFFFSSRRRHTRCREVSWARRCVQETGTQYKKHRQIQDIEEFYKKKCGPLLDPALKKIANILFSGIKSKTAERPSVKDKKMRWKKEKSNSACLGEENNDSSWEEKNI
eukprot:TRINITY_DN5969_c0_g1_i1.p3 TRINITY_DN5969_c0_g1~~TRINITY_DN5969_c0_g1_i1.p3  ORF type:complete len:132 (-),score=33.98 TRINITY_DN5969_c0_g1_i1:825-1220(-)